MQTSIVICKSNEGLFDIMTTEDQQSKAGKAAKSSRNEWIEAGRRVLYFNPFPLFILPSRIPSSSSPPPPLPSPLSSDPPSVAPAIPLLRGEGGKKKKKKKKHPRIRHMGIQNLLRFLKPFIRPVHIRKYAGKRVDFFGPL